MNIIIFDQAEFDLLFCQIQFLFFSIYLMKLLEDTMKFTNNKLKTIMFIINWLKK